MESKHFSHNHGLFFHQVPQGSQTICSGCKSPASGNVYVCWLCSFFLHEQCFRASRSLRHPSHPLHPLTLMPFPTYPSCTFFCNSCSLSGDGFSYSCSACEFDVHVDCALVPTHNPHVSSSSIPTTNFYSQPQNPIQTNPPQNAIIPNKTDSIAHQHSPPPGYPQPNATPQTFVPPVNDTTSAPPPPPPPPVSQPPPVQTNSLQTIQPTKIKHFSHPHILKPFNIKQDDAKLCSACELELSGSVYTCTESHCTFNLHKACFDYPREIRHKSHHHPLTLLSATPYNDRFTCDACRKVGKAFVYNCRTCSYDLHIDCIRWSDTVTRPDHKHPLTLYYSSAIANEGQEVTFTCDVCKDGIDETAWVYYCRECDFGTHLECVRSEIKEKEVDDDEKTEDVGEKLLKLQEQQMLLNFQMQMARQNAQFMSSLANSWNNL